MIPPSVIAPQALFLRSMATLVVRRLMAPEEALAAALPPALETVRRTMPDYSDSGLRAQLASILGDAVVRHDRACGRVEWSIRFALRAMIRGPQAPTEGDPRGMRRPTSAELLAEARAINQRYGAPLWADPALHPIDEVTEIVQEEVLSALRREAPRRSARRRAA